MSMFYYVNVSIYQVGIVSMCQCLSVSLCQCLSENHCVNVLVYQVVDVSMLCLMLHCVNVEMLQWINV
jgi:hypothetical protein